MTARCLLPLFIIPCSLGVVSCGNTAAEDPGGAPVVQGGLKALSLNGSTIRFEWSPIQGVPDSSILGYSASWTGGSDTLPKTALSLDVDSLLPGEILFSVSARLEGQAQGPTATIRWAPAARFDTPLTLTEYYSLETQRPAGLDAGGSASNPVVLAIETNNPTVAQTLDLYLWGGEGMLSEPLALRSAHLLLGSWNTTVFSTVSHASASLDLPLDRFPSIQTFALDAVPVAANTIFYARVVGNQGGVNYVRIHVGEISGAGRSRSIAVRLSLQRVPGLLFAQCPGGEDISWRSPYRHSPS
jgi:hypothetical protein